MSEDELVIEHLRNENCAMARELEELGPFTEIAKQCNAAVNELFHWKWVIVLIIIELFRFGCELREWELQRQIHSQLEQVEIDISHLPKRPHYPVR